MHTRSPLSGEPPCLPSPRCISGCASGGIARTPQTHTHTLHAAREAHSPPAGRHTGGHLAPPRHPGASHAFQRLCRVAGRLRAGQAAGVGRRLAGGCAGHGLGRHLSQHGGSHAAAARPPGQPSGRRAAGRGGDLLPAGAWGAPPARPESGGPGHRNPSTNARRSPALSRWEGDEPRSGVHGACACLRCRLPLSPSLNIVTTKGRRAIPAPNSMPIRAPLLLSWSQDRHTVSRLPILFTHSMAGGTLLRSCTERPCHSHDQCGREGQERVDEGAGM